VLGDPVRIFEDGSRFPPKGEFLGRLPAAGSRRGAVALISRRLSYQVEFANWPKKLRTVTLVTSLGAGSPIIRNMVEGGLPKITALARAPSKK
jgi:hypothetical protein